MEFDNLTKEEWQKSLENGTDSSQDFSETNPLVYVGLVCFGMLLGMFIFAGVHKFSSHHKPIKTVDSIRCDVCHTTPDKLLQQLSASGF